MEKIKAFFQNTITKVVSWIVLAVAIIALIIGGATVETINSGVVLVSAIVSAISALIAFIAGQIKK